MQPRLITLDFESVLVPEAWIAIADALGVSEMRKTTKDEPDFAKLMKMRMDILRREGVTLTDLQEILGKLEPLPGAVSFFEKLRTIAPVIIVSDSFMEFTWPQLPAFSYPAIFCHTLTTDAAGHITGYTFRQNGDKGSVVQALQSVGLAITAMGDSFNDIGMLTKADRSALLFSDAPVRKTHPNIPALDSYDAALDFARRN